MSLLPGASPKDELLSLINANNPSVPVPITDENLYFGNARLDTDGVTSIVPTVATLGEQYTGYLDFRYQRINLSVVYDQRPVLKSVGDVSLYKMLSIVNQFLGLNLTEQDVVDTNIANVVAGASVNINVQTVPGSLGYTGAFVFQFFRERPDLTAAIRNFQLDILSYPADPTQNKLDLDSLMWNIDFSPFTATLAVTNNYWKNAAGVQQLMADEFDFDDWPLPVALGVTDYPTSAYPGANTNFQRVTVQKMVVGSTYIGNALFHYNPS